MENWFFQFFASSDVTRALKLFQLKSSILSALMMSLDGKNQFSMEGAHWAKTQE